MELKSLRGSRDVGVRSHVGFAYGGWRESFLLLVLFFFVWLDTPLVIGSSVHHFVAPVYPRRFFLHISPQFAPFSSLHMHFGWGGVG